MHSARGARRGGKLPGHRSRRGTADSPTPDPADNDADLLVAALEEVIYLLDTTGEAPADVSLGVADGGVDMTLAMADAGTVPQLGAVPKAVSLNDLQLAHGEHGWRCSVTLDV